MRRLFCNTGMRNAGRQERGVTIVEILIGFAIFTIIMTLVVSSLVMMFRSFQQGERFADKQQKQRICFLRMGRTISSLVNLTIPGKAPSFRGDASSFYIIYAQAENLAEEKYVCDASALVRYFEAPADFKEDSYQAKDTCFDGLQECAFSYSDGTLWKEAWHQEDGVPKAVKLRFKFKDDAQAHEFLANVPVSP